MGKIATSEDWKQFFIDGKEVAIAAPILENWTHSREAGLDPYGLPAPADQKDDSQESKNISSTLNSILKESWVANEKTAIAWLICDHHGTITHLQCAHEELSSTLEAAGLKEGKSLRTSHSGSNAVALSMEKGTTQICRGAEHFLSKLHSLTSSATPFYDICGEISGYLGLIGLASQAQPKLFFGLLRMTILTLDRQFRLIRSKELHQRVKARLGEMLQDDSKAMLLANPGGYVRFINPAAMKLFDLHGALTSEKSLDKLVKFTPPIKKLVRSAIFEKAAMEIRLSDRDLDVTCTKTPIFNEKDAFVGCLLSFERHVQRDNHTNSSFEAKYRFNDIIGSSLPLKHALRLAQRAAEASVNVLLMGASGAGKEMFAQSIHNASDRKKKPFIAINCAAIPREIAESELFGHTPGAFTGADKNGREGKLVAANGGTVFLDEIGDMPLELQAKLLRTLQERNVTPIGSSKSIPVDIRVIAATNKDIPDLISNNEFREDLYYRINVFTIRLPSLENCKEDIPVLIESFVEYFNESTGKKVKGVASEIMDHFLHHSWPGNIRELRNTIEFAVMLNSGHDHITWKDLPGELRANFLYRRDNPENETPDDKKDPLGSERKTVEDSEKTLYEKAIRMSGGNLSEAARILKIGRSTLYRKLKKLNISTPKDIFQRQ